MRRRPLLAESPADQLFTSWVSKLARLLPPAERARFVAEALGNLGGCNRWWHRVDVLVCLALGMPRLAWMMRRDGRRGRV